jgi:hypothetical protein
MQLKKENKDAPCAHCNKSRLLDIGRVYSVSLVLDGNGKKMDAATELLKSNIFYAAMQTRYLFCLSGTDFNQHSH